MRLIFLHTVLIWLVPSYYVFGRDRIKPNYIPYCTTRDRCKPACSCEVAPNCFVLELDDNARKSIVDYHNQIRDIQSTGEPIPGGMTMLQYDENLEQISRCGAARCEDQYSECFITTKFNETSQAAVQIALQPGTEPKVSLLLQMMNSWLGQAKVISAETLSDMPAGEEGEKIHNFAQLVSDRILFVGCSWSRSDQTLTFVCTYGPRGPVQGEAIYKIGRLCTLCPEHYACDHAKPFSRLCKQVLSSYPAPVQTPPPPPPIAPQPEVTAPPEPPPQPPKTTKEVITTPPTPPPFQTQPVLIPVPNPPPTLPSAMTEHSCPTTQMPMGAPPLLPPQEPPPIPMAPQRPAASPPMQPAQQPVPQGMPPVETPVLPLAPEPMPEQPVQLQPPVLPQAPAFIPPLPPQVPPSGLTPEELRPQEFVSHFPPPMPPRVPFSPTKNDNILPIAPDPPPVPPRTPPMLFQSTYPVFQQQPQCPPRFLGRSPPRLPHNPPTGCSVRERIEVPPSLPQEPPTLDGVYGSPQLPVINAQTQTYFPPQPPPLPHIINTPPPLPRAPLHHPQQQPPPQPPVPQSFMITPPPLPELPPHPVPKPFLPPSIPTDQFARPPYLPQLPMEPEPKPPSLPRIPHQVFPHQFVQPMPPPRIPPLLELGGR